MASERSQTLFELLDKSGLLPREQLDELRGLPEARDPDPRVLGRVVLQRGWLTKYQVAQVAVGKARDLHVGAYLLVDRLGEGGMGQVFKAQHQHMRRTVALKVIRKEKLGDADSVKRFYQEVEAAARLSHPNIVIAHDAGQVGATHFLAMEYVAGIDLARLVKQKGPLPIAQACDFIRQAALGLQHAHERGMVHRDIKPHNLLVSVAEGKAEGEKAGKTAVVKILDMGLARLSGGGEKDRALTQTGSVMGTPEYLAPEQALDSRQADIRSDIYSLGCSFYFLLAGRAPFQGDSLTQVLLQHQMEECTPLAELRKDLAPGLERITRKMMAKDPAGRYQTPAEVAAALEAFSRGSDAAVLPEVGEENPFAEIGPEEHTLSSSGISKRGKLPVREEKEATQALEKGHTSPRRSGAHRRLAGGKRDSKRTLLLAGGIGGGVVLLLGLVLGVWLLSRPPEAQTSPETEEVVEGPTPTPPGPSERPTEQKPARAKVDENTGGVLLRWAADGAAVREVGFSPGGDLLAVARQDGLVKVWNTKTGAEVSSFKGHGADVRSVAFSPEGNRAVSGGADGRVLLWDPLTGQTLQDLQPPLPDLHRVCFGPRGDHVLGVGGTACHRWALTGAGGAVLFRLSGCRITSNLASTPDGARRFVGGDNGTVHELLGSPNAPGEPFAGHRGPVRSVAVSSTHEQMLSGSDDGTVRLWSTGTRGLVHTFTEHRGEVLDAGFSPDGRLVLSGSADRQLRLWDVSSHLLLWTHTCGGPVRSARFSPGETVLAAGTEDGEVVLLQPPKKVFWTGSLAAVTPTPPRPTPVVAPSPPHPAGPARIEGAVRVYDRDWSISMKPVFSPDGRHVLMARQRANATMLLMDAEAGTVVRTFSGPGTTVFSGLFDATGKKLLSAAFDRKLRLWNAQTCEELKVLSGHPTGVRLVDFTPDARFAVSAAGHFGSPGSPGMDLDRAIRVWDVQAGTELRRYDRHQMHVDALAVTPDGSKVFSTSRDHSALWELATGREVAPLAKQISGETVTDAVFSADGRRLLLFGRGPRLLHLWDVEKDQEIRRLDAPFSLQGVDLSPGGNYYATGSGHARREGDRVVWVDCEVQLRDTSDGSVVRRFEGFPNFVRHVVFSPDASRLLAFSSDGTAALLDTQVKDPGTPVAASSPAPPGDRPRHPVPEEAGLAEARKLVRDTYKEDFAGRQPADWISLSTKLLEKAGENAEGSPARYALLDEARLLAVRAGEARLVMQAVERLAGEFEVGRLELALKALTEASRACDTPLEQQALAASCLLAVEHSLEEDSFEKARELVKLADAAAVKTADATLVGHVRARGKEVQDVEKEYQAAAEAEKTLEGKPGDPEASLTRGRYLCLRKGEWERGLPLLAAGSDAGLKEVAGRDAAGPTAAAEQLEVADDWFALAAGEKGGTQAAIHRRALHWYEAALAGLTGLERDRVEKRVKELTAALPGHGVDSLSGEIRKLERHTARVSGVSFLPQGKQAVSVGLDSKVTRWDLETGKVLESRPLTSSEHGLTSLGVSANGKWAVAGSKGGHVAFHSLEPGEGRGGLFLGGKAVKDVTFVGKSDTTLLVTCANGGPTYWARDGRAEIKTLGERPLQDAVAVASSAEGRFAYFGSATGPIHVYDLLSRRLAGSLLGHVGPVHALAASPDGQLLVSGGEDGTVRVWSLKTLKALRLLRGHAGPVRSVAASSSFDVILSGGEDRTVRLWDSRHGALRRTFRGHAGPVWAVAISPDGSRGLSGSEDTTLRLWDLRGR